MFQNKIGLLFVSIIIFFSIIFLEIIFVSIVTQSLPNQFVFTVMENFSFFIDLLNTNPETAAWIILIDNPVLIIQRIDELEINQLWGIYLMPISILTQLTISLISAAWIKRSNSILCSWAWLASASLILLFSTFYLKIQTCCTTRPTWIFEIFLFSRITDPNLDTAFWQEIYINLNQWFPLIQFSLASIALSIFFICFNTNLFSRNKHL